jgi:peptidoglycan hydrolase CwlO-like protein
LAQAAEEAELLVAAQAQAQAEDEIQGRLPREVLNINKRLDHQQQSVDELQGNISKLTDMVSQLGKSWNSTESS